MKREIIDASQLELVDQVVDIKPCPILIFFSGWVL